jgi:hypothetical protein
MSNLPYHGRELPAASVHSYIAGWSSVIGRCGANASVNWQANQLIPDSEQKIAWLEPMYSYVGTSKDKGPVDYLQVALLYWSLSPMYKIPPEQLATDRLAVRLYQVVAQYWWWGNSYVRPDPFLSLRALCEPAFNNWLSALYAGAGARMSLTQISCLSFRQLMQLFGQVTGIPYQCTISAQQIVVQITECPCCLSQPQECWFFVELIDNMLAWLFGKYQAVPTPACLAIDREASAGHTIVLQIVPDV